jgi:hypothetical protein
MSDIVERLRNWRSVHLARLHLLMNEAADEMERLRLTAEERDVLAAIEADASYRAMKTTERVVRRLLDRLG